MKVSGFTFLRNGQEFGYPFIQSIRSILPLVDEFIIVLGLCDDDTEKTLRRHSYRLVKRTWLNNWYIPTDSSATVRLLNTPAERW